MNSYPGGALYDVDMPRRKRLSPKSTKPRGKIRRRGAIFAGEEGFSTICAPNWLGDIEMNFGKGGLTQYAASQGTVDVTLLDQDGYASGSLTSIGVSDGGRITATYSNGQTVNLSMVYDLVWEAGDWKLVVTNPAAPINVAQIPNVSGYIAWEE